MRCNKLHSKSYNIFSADSHNFHHLSQFCFWRKDLSFRPLNFDFYLPINTFKLNFFENYHRFPTFSQTKPPLIISKQRVHHQKTLSLSAPSSAVSLHFQWQMFHNRRNFRVLKTYVGCQPKRKTTPRDGVVVKRTCHRH